MLESDANNGESLAKKRPVLRWVLLAVVVLLLVAVLGKILFRQVEGKMQRDFDSARIRSVTDLAARIVTFRDEIGRCPLGHLADEETVTVLLTHVEPRGWPEGAPQILPPEALIEDLKAVEGEGVVLPSDPQMATYDFWPAIQYETNGKGFTVGVSLYHPEPRAEPRGPYWHKLDLVGSCAPGSGHALSRSRR